MEIVHDNDNTMLFGKVWLYILDKDENVKYQDWAVCEIDKYEENLISLLESFDEHPKLEKKELTNSLEYRYNVKDSDKYILVYAGVCLMKEYEFQNIIKEKCFGRLDQRLATS